MSQVSYNVHERLVVGLKNDEPEVIGLLYDTYSDALYGIILRIVKYEEEAADCLQEVFVRIWKNRAKYNSEKGRLFTWMSRIARNTALNVIESKGYKARSQIQNPDESVYKNESQYSLPVETLGLRGLVSNLEQKYSEIIDLLYFQGFTQKEASEHLDLPLGTVKTRAKNALQQLRKIYLEVVISWSITSLSNIESILPL